MPASITTIKGVLKPKDRSATGSGGQPSQPKAGRSQAKEALKNILRRLVTKKRAQANGVTFGKTKVFVHEAEQGHRLKPTPRSVRKKGYTHDNALKRLDVKLAEKRALQSAEELAEAVEGMYTQTVSCMTAVGPSMWLMDTGTPFDIVSQQELSDELQARKYKTKLNVNLQTANGIAKIKWQVPLKVKMSPAWRETIRPIMMEGTTPAALSIGRRCVVDGYSFHWPAFGDPTFVDPHGRNIPLVVSDYCPYIFNCLVGCAPGIAAAPSQSGQSSAISPGGAEIISGGRPSLVVEVPPVVEDIQVDAQVAVTENRKDLKAIALSDAHQLTHFPKNPYCPTCQRAKMVQKSQRRNKLPVDRPKTFGQQVVADHLIAQSELDKGINGETCALIICDRHTDILACYPLRKKDKDEAYTALNDFEGAKRC